MNRRDLLTLLGVSAIGCGSASGSGQPAQPAVAAGRELPFRPVPLPLPVPADGLPAAQQRHHLRQVRLEDRLVVPAGYRAEVVAAWGEPLGEGRYGFNNDHIAFTSLETPERALLTVNFEYLSARVWGEGFAEATGSELPLQELRAALASRSGTIDGTALAADDPLRELVRRVATAALEDLGLGVLEIRRQPDGGWRRRAGPLDRRIHGLAGLAEPGERLRLSGPAAAVMRRAQRQGWDDGLGETVIGTFANCAGGETPWGTVLSAEENFQDQVVEAVFADGSSPAPAGRPFRWDGRRLEGLGNPFGLAGNKYGWMVEVDPRQPQRPAVKHSWLGRFRHEAVAVRAEAGRHLTVYSGCDRHGGHLYRFVSTELIRDPGDPRNSLLFESGRLEVARFTPDGRGEWIPLAPDTAVRPLPPGHFRRFGLDQPTLVPHRDRERAGAEALASDAEVEAYRRLHPTLASLYRGEGEERMGAILIDAHLAANAVGATPGARPEDTVIDPASGDLLIAFTSAGSDPAQGTADPAIFAGPAGEPLWPHGWVMRLSEEVNGGFRWRLVATGGTPWQGGLGFSHPDNLAVDRAGRIWITTDRPTRSTALDVFGNNSCWVLPRHGAAAGQALCFATAPMESELCGPCFDADQSSLFLAVQHPGEDHGNRLGGAGEWRSFELVDRDGHAFQQRRWIPLGSNWPSGVPGRPPRPGLVAIRRLAGGPLLPG
jgi:hypothetical protein